MRRRAVVSQNHGQQHRVGEAVTHAVQPAQRVGNGVDVAHTGAGEGHARLIGGGEQCLPRLHVVAVGAGVLQPAEDGDHRLLRHGVGLAGGVKPADICLHRVSQGVHAGLGGGVGRQGHGEQWIQHGAAGDQAQVVDGVLVVIRAGDHGGDGGLRAGTGGGGYGDKGRNGAAHLQETRQLLRRLAGAHHQRCGGLGGVHGTAAAHRHQAVAMRLSIQGGRRLHGGHRRVGLYVGEQGIALQPGQHLLKGGVGTLTAAGHHQRAAGAVPGQPGGDVRQTAGAGDHLRLTPRQQPCAQPNTH